MEEIKVKFDLGKVQYEEIDGTKSKVEAKVKGFRKFIAESLYYNTSNLGLRVFSIDLFKSEVVQVDRAQLEAIKAEIINLNLLNPIAPSFEKVISDCLTELDKDCLEEKKRQK